MFKHIMGAVLIAILLQMTAFVSAFAGQHPAETNHLQRIVYKSVVRNKTRNPSDYISPEVFANFREIQTTGLKEKTVYRSSNPIDVIKNKVRHKYADELARKAGINAEIDLADDDKMVKRYFSEFCGKVFVNIYTQEAAF